MADISAGLRARTLLAASGFRATHSLGQNFLLDEGLLAHLLDLSGVGPDDHVLEIGPGPGLSTRLLSERARDVVAVELDEGLRPVLSQMLSDCPNARVVYGDALKVDLAPLVAGPFRVVANLPYYITSEILLKLLLSGLPLRSLALLVQKEAAERLLSSPGEKRWCQLAAVVQYFGAPEMLLEVPPEAFEPRPHVTSAFLRIDLYEKRPVVPRDEALFLRVLAAAFAMRRKTLANNLKAAFGASAEEARALVAAAGADERARGEALTLSQLARLSDALGAR